MQEETSHILLNFSIETSRIIVIVVLPIIVIGFLGLIYKDEIKRRMTTKLCKERNKDLSRLLSK